MKGFKDYKEGFEAQQMATEVDEYFEAENIEVLFERGGNKAWVKVASLMLHTKVNYFGGKVKNEDDISKKLDYIAEQNRFIAAFINLSIAATVDDKAVFKKVK